MLGRLSTDRLEFSKKKIKQIEFMHGFRVQQVPFPLNLQAYFRSRFAGGSREGNHPVK